MGHDITAFPESRTIVVHTAGRGETPACAAAKFQRGDVVRVRRRKTIAHFPAKAVVAVAVPPGFPAEYALADLMDESRPLMIRKPRSFVSYILVNEGDLTPYLAHEKDLLPTDETRVEIGKFSRAPRSND